MRSVIRSTGLTVLLAAGLLAGACNDENDNLANPATPTPTPTPAPEPTPTPAPTPSPTPDATSESISFLGKLRLIDEEDQKLTVSGGWDVLVRPETEIIRDGQPIGIADLVIGEMLRVSGTVEADATVMASRVVADPYDDQ